MFPMLHILYCETHFPIGFNALKFKIFTAFLLIICVDKHKCFLHAIINTYWLPLCGLIANCHKLNYFRSDKR